MTPRRLAAGILVLALTLAACTTGATTEPPPAGATRALGLAFRLPPGFTPEDPGDDARPRDAELFWTGPTGEDGTAAGITVSRWCDRPLPSWDQVRADAESGQHTAWSDYRLAAPPVDVDVDGAADALRVRGTYELARASDDQEVELVHDALFMHNEDVLHQFRVEGTTANVESIPLEDLFAGVQVVSTACPV